jgi:hypothetical protein
MQASTSTQLPVTTPTAEAESCVPFTLFQGPETWGFDLSEPHAGGTQLTGRCTWNGAFTAAKLKCTSGRNMGTTEFIGQEALRTTENAFAVATLVKAETTASASYGSCRDGWWCCSDWSCSLGVLTFDYFLSIISMPLDDFRIRCFGTARTVLLRACTTSLPSTAYSLTCSNVDLNTSFLRI